MGVLGGYKYSTALRSAQIPKHFIHGRIAWNSKQFRLWMTAIYWRGHQLECSLWFLSFYIKHKHYDFEATAARSNICNNQAPLNTTTLLTSHKPSPLTSPTLPTHLCLTQSPHTALLIPLYPCCPNYTTKPTPRYLRQTNFSTLPLYSQLHSFADPLANLLGYTLYLFTLCTPPIQVTYPHTQHKLDP